MYINKFQRDGYFGDYPEKATLLTNSIFTYN